MAARSGMVDLINQFRSLVDDAGTVSFTDDRAQQILDDHRIDFYQLPLAVTPQQVALGSVTYQVYTATYGNLEGTASGTVAYRLFDSSGTVISSGYTLDAQRGIFTFSANQAGSARYLDGRSYDLFGAAADGWRERAGKQSGSFDFRVEGRAYNRSQWFTHCAEMAKYYESMGRPSQAVMERGDMTC